SRRRDQPSRSRSDRSGVWDVTRRGLAAGSGRDGGSSPKSSAITPHRADINNAGAPILRAPIELFIFNLDLFIHLSPGISMLIPAEVLIDRECHAASKRGTNAAKEREARQKPAPLPSSTSQGHTNATVRLSRSCNHFEGGIL